MDGSEIRKCFSADNEFDNNFKIEPKSWLNLTSNPLLLTNSKTGKSDSKN